LVHGLVIISLFLWFRFQFGVWSCDHLPLPLVPVPVWCMVL
jgi:hypothetical protein